MTHVDSLHRHERHPVLVFAARRRCRLAVMLLLLGLPLVAIAAPASGQKWVTTWAQSMTSNAHRVKSADGTVRQDASGHPVERAPAIHDATLRQTVLTSVGGDRVRIHLSNYYGLKPLTISAARVARGAMSQSKDLSSIDTASDHRLTFDGGKTSITLAPGQSVYSDPASMHVPALAHLVVSLYFGKTAHLADRHPMENAHTTDVVAGNRTRSKSLHGQPVAAGLDKKAHFHIYELDAVDVQAPAATRGIVAFGDSITDGAYATDLSKPWPEALSSIANGSHGGTPVAVANAGISADELTTDQIGNPAAGASGLKRFERDVIDQPGVTDVIVLFGANDLNRGIDAAGYPNGASAGDLIAGFRMLIDVAHQHHLRIYAGTITPFAGFPARGWYSPRKEAIRKRVNHWIRTSGAFDGVIDFAKALRGPYTPAPLAAEHHPLPSGMATVCTSHGLHPNDRGYAVMGAQAYDVLFHAQVQAPQGCH